MPASTKATTRTTTETTQFSWTNRLNSWGTPTSKVTDNASLDPGLRLVNQFRDEETGLHYNVGRYYDPSKGRFISTDPTGVSDAADANVPENLLLDTTAYASGQPSTYFDPDGAAKLSYYAVTTGTSAAKEAKIGSLVQGFTLARWSFVISDIKAGTDTTSDLGKFRNQYSKDGSKLLFDKRGDFIGSKDDPLTSGRNAQGTAISWKADEGNSALDAYVKHYGDNLIAIPQFTVDDFDDDKATKLMLYLSRSSADRKPCDAAALTWLPEIKFAPGEANMTPTRSFEPAASGSSLKQANAQRILNCNPEDSMPTTYENDEQRARIKKYQAAAELQESPARSAIYRDCSTNDGCRSTNAININGRKYYASYGRSQFLVETFLTTLQGNVNSLTADQKTKLRLSESVSLPNGRRGTMLDMIDLAKKQSTSASREFNDIRDKYGRGKTLGEATAIWDNLKQSEKDKYVLKTGFGKTEFIDMLGFTVSGRAQTEAEARYAFGSEAAMRMLDGNSHTSFKNWAMWLFSSQDEFNFITRLFLNNNLTYILNNAPNKTIFVNSEAPGTQAQVSRQREIERTLSSRVAIFHNSGRGDFATQLIPKLPTYIQSYVEEFIGVAGRGDWQSLRCGIDMKKVPGIEMSKLALN
jgi:RHS repeat-associated protein